MADLTAFIDKHFSATRMGTEAHDLTIKAVRVEEVGQDKESKPVVSFVEDKRGLVLTGGRYDELAKACGTRDVDKWVGVKVRIKVDPSVMFKGKKVGGIVLEVLKAK